MEKKSRLHSVRLSDPMFSFQSAQAQVEDRPLGYEIRRFIALGIEQQFKRASNGSTRKQCLHRRNAA